jgi:hypothetical protein
MNMHMVERTQREQAETCVTVAVRPAVREGSLCVGKTIAGRRDESMRPGPSKVYSSF